MLLFAAEGVFLGNLMGLGVTAGAHRLWSHRSYDARLPLRVFLMLVQTLSGQVSRLHSFHVRRCKMPRHSWSLSELHLPMGSRTQVLHRVVTSH